MSEHETVTLQQPLRLVGVSGMVEKDAAPQQIGELWQRAAAAGLLRPDRPAFAAYYDYEDRLANRYRVLIGLEGDDEPGPDQDVVELPAGDYARFGDEGPAVEVTQKLWRQVWTRWSERDRRRFDVDVERHEGGLDQAKVALLIGVK